MDLKTKLLNNLILASKVAERDGITIINKYNSINGYFGAKNRKDKQKIRKAKKIGNQERALRITGNEGKEEIDEPFSSLRVS